MNKLLRNHLEEWKLTHYWSSADLNLSSKRYKRKSVEILYGRLRKALPEKFYQANSRFLDSHKSNWIHSLLAQQNHLPSIIALDDFVTLIEYIHQKGGILLKTLNSHLYRYDRLRDFLFEVYIYRLLELSGISFEPKKQIKNREVEGVCTIGGLEFLFECKKIYMPDVEWWNLVRYLFFQVDEKIQTSNNLRAAKDGLIGVIKLNITDDNEKQIKKIKAAYTERINSFFKEFNKSKYNSVQYKHNDPEKYGIFEIVDYSPEKFKEYQDNAETYNILFKITPPPILSTVSMNHYRGVTYQHFGFKQEEVIEKFKNALAKKLNQLADTTRRIFFFESESTNDLSKLDLFKMPSMFDESKIMPIIGDKLRPDDILCIILKKYGNDTEPQTQFFVYGGPNHPEVKNIITNLARNKRFNIGEEPLHI